MRPGLVVKLRPNGPWRIGPDSGARNRVDVIYHSDSLYSAVTLAMGRMGQRDEWLAATVGEPAPAVCFSSCFPFLNEIRLVVPPRTLWPPKASSLTSGRVRWKSARFVPLDVVRAMLAGKPLDEDEWSVDGPSECLVPAGRGGPFRTSVRWSAAVDRLTGASERHATACIEFRSGAGLWTIAGFRDEEAHARWLEPVKAAFRLLADSGFGGERSRGWGRSDTPEFIEGSLPEMILADAGGDRAAGDQGPVASDLPDAGCRMPDADDRAAGDQGPVASDLPDAGCRMPDAGDRAAGNQVAPGHLPPDPEPEPAVGVEPPIPPATVSAAVEAEPPLEPASGIWHPASEIAPDPEVPLAHRPRPPAPVWLLSLFTPAAADAVDWGRGNYGVLGRGGRIDSPAGSGELKKQLQMVVEGSVLFAEGVPSGSAPDVAPEGFAHPVFRAGFALAIPLPEGS